MRNARLPVFLLSIVALILVSGCGPSKNLSLVERREVVADMEDKALQRLYGEEPASKAKVRDSAGYGVFSNANVNLIFASGGGGYGVVVNNTTGDRTYMKMALAGIGIGLGVKDYRQVLIFKNEETLSTFVEHGWDFGGHADAAAKAGESGGEMSGEGDIDENIEVYSMTESGLALQATLAGTKYWKDDSLN